MQPGRPSARRRPLISSMTPPLISFLSLLIFAVQESRSVCVNTTSESEEAVFGREKKLICILCMRREEIPAVTTVKWYYTPTSEAEKTTHLIYEYPQREIEGPLKDRVVWNGSKDLQDVSILITKISLNDSGTYTCEVNRKFSFSFYSPSITNKWNTTLKVTTKASRDTTALYSEIMMYVLLVFLTFWLLVEMIYCYRKISKSDEQAQDSATDYLAIPSENRENPGPAVTE